MSTGATSRSLPAVHDDRDTANIEVHNNTLHEPYNLDFRRLAAIEYKRNLRKLYQEWFKMWHKQYFETGNWKRGNEGDGVEVIIASGKVGRFVEDMPRETTRPNYLSEIECYWRTYQGEHVRHFGALWEWVAQRPLNHDQW